MVVVPESLLTGTEIAGVALLAAAVAFVAEAAGETEAAAGLAAATADASAGVLTTEATGAARALSNFSVVCVLIPLEHNCS